MLKFDELIEGLGYFAEVKYFESVKFNGRTIKNAYAILNKDVMIELEGRGGYYLVSIYLNGLFMDCELILKNNLLHIIAWAACKIQVLGLND